MSYCTRQHVIDRLSDTGILNCVDDNDDGALSTAEGLLVDDAIEAVSAEIDGYLTPVIEVLPVTTANRWLRDRCVDLACARLATRRGMSGGGMIEANAAASRALLEQVASRAMRVPYLLYPGDSYRDERLLLGRPVVGNPC